MSTLNINTLNCNKVNTDKLTITPTYFNKIILSASLTSSDGNLVNSPYMKCIGFRYFKFILSDDSLSSYATYINNLKVKYIINNEEIILSIIKYPLIYNTNYTYHGIFTGASYGYVSPSTTYLSQWGTFELNLDKTISVKGFSVTQGFHTNQQYMKVELYNNDLLVYKNEVLQPDNINYPNNRYYIS